MEFDYQQFLNPNQGFFNLEYFICLDSPIAFPENQLFLSLELRFIVFDQFGCRQEFIFEFKITFL